MSSTISLHLKVRILRLLTRLLAWLDRRRGPTCPPGPSFIRKIPSTLSTKPGTFELFFYYPKDHDHKTKKPIQYPVVINFHGGGWTVAHARDDERFISHLTARGAVVISVNYRLAPEHPYPVPIEDCLDAILYVWANAEALGIHKHRTILTGFSVGAHMTMSSQFLLWSLIQDKVPRVNQAHLGTVKGITGFYPPMDLTKSRDERALSNPAFMAMKKKPVSSSKLVGETFDQAFFWRVKEVPDKGYMYVSPGLAEEEVVREALPEKISFKLAGLDYILVEGRVAAERFSGLGKDVACKVVDGVLHYWDHTAKTEEKRLRDAVYKEAADEIEEVWEVAK